MSDFDLDFEDFEFDPDPGPDLVPEPPIEPFVLPEPLPASPVIQSVDPGDPFAGFAGQVIGQPELSTPLWHQQLGPASCAVAAQEFLLEAETGSRFDELALAPVAERNGWFDPISGTPANHVGDLMEAYGVEVTRTHGSMAELVEVVASGKDVIVAVDSSELWDPSTALHDAPVGPGDADHVVVVTGFDFTDPNDPIAVINDPGDPNGAGRHLSTDVFEMAAEDSRMLMVYADQDRSALPPPVDLADAAGAPPVMFGTSWDVDGVTESGDGVMWSTTSNAYHNTRTHEVVEEVW